MHTSLHRSIFLLVYLTVPHTQPPAGAPARAHTHVQETLFLTLRVFRLVSHSHAITRFGRAGADDGDGGGVGVWPLNDDHHQAAVLYGRAEKRPRNPWAPVAADDVHDDAHRGGAGGGFGGAGGGGIGVRFGVGGGRGRGSGVFAPHASDGRAAAAAAADPGPQAWFTPRRRVAAAALGGGGGAVQSPPSWIAPPVAQQLHEARMQHMERYHRAKFDGLRISTPTPISSHSFVHAHAQPGGHPGGAAAAAAAAMFSDAPVDAHVSGAAWLQNVSPSYVPRGPRKRRASDSMSDEGGHGYDDDDGDDEESAHHPDDATDGGIARGRSVRPRHDGVWGGGVSGDALAGEGFAFSHLHRDHQQLQQQHDRPGYAHPGFQDIGRRGADATTDHHHHEQQQQQQQRHVHHPHTRGGSFEHDPPSLAAAAAVAPDAASQPNGFRSLLNQLHHERALRSPRVQRHPPTARYNS
jgi:hypothetical protein